jgi:hypothetical protein
LSCHPGDPQPQHAADSTAGATGTAGATTIDKRHVLPALACVAWATPSGSRC